MVASIGPAALAQEPQETGEQAAMDPPVVIDLTLPSSSPASSEECDEQADAARIAGEIVVCRSLGEESDGYYDPQRVQEAVGRRTIGPIAPDVDGSGLKLPTEGSLIAIIVTVPTGEPGEQPLMVDLEALPEAPPGSDADRIAKGLSLKN